MLRAEITTIVSALGVPQAPKFPSGYNTVWVVTNGVLTTSSPEPAQCTFSANSVCTGDNSVPSCTSYTSTLTC